ncbi:bacillithiol biosynthesis cysteine-adding enzyme BshC [Alteribacillus sp. JSM 102045]|uniref:bacillithiol biosynthesis cysteine-adding enzyme BshC n=1 Tax=Alteribacillus sp. JSM 102045 TaxID=1562101 RepID=UPI0035BF8F61
MDVYETDMPQSHPFIRDYLKNIEQACSFFDYRISDNDFRQRYKELKDRSFDKDGLYQHLYTYNKSFVYHEKALEELEKLKNPNAVMVVAGQQAGLVTGPLYTISKAVTALKEAKKQEQLLGVPVLPLFWIAGEDHDWEEVNHVFLPGEEAPKKYTYKGGYYPGAPISKQPIEEEAFEKWWYKVTECLPETNHTEEIYYTLRNLANRSFTFTDFFGEVMRWLFRDSGLILMDADHPEIRNLEKETLASLLKEYKEVKEAVQQGKKNRENLDYPLPEGLPQEGIHLFYHYRRQRHLLYERDDVSFTDKTGNAVFYKNELLDHLADSPNSFSTNVFTRPLVQEKLLPVLSFAAGPGEINYWSLLKPLFHRFAVKVPPIQPRMEFTIVPRNIQSILQKENLSVRQILLGEADKKIQEVKEKAKQVDGKQLAENLLSNIANHHKTMREEWKKLNPSEESYGDKNWYKLQSTVLNFAKKIDSYQEGQEECRLQKLRITTQLLFPFARSQERVINIIYFINEYGSDLVTGINALYLQMNKRHKIIYL